MQKHIELYKMFFDHGVDTLLTPVIGPEILETRNAYMQKIGAEGLARISTHAEFVRFYEEYDVQARFYGDYRNHLEGTPYEQLPDILDELVQRTKNNQGFRLFFGAFADNLNSTHIIAKNAVNYYKQYGEVPERKNLIEMYYGDYIEKVDFFIGFDRLATFDYPLLNSGEEDLYFTIAPSLYLNKIQLRRILYDHLFTRRIQDRDYETLSPDELMEMRTYYHDHISSIIGIGKIKHGFWIPDTRWQGSSS
ncbi:MAG: hypothetical protein JXA13_07435 [Anaerolineales bacterium]|nr:hypothetical protein [Anaerolineales bacterium]